MKRIVAMAALALVVVPISGASNHARGQQQPGVSAAAEPQVESRPRRARPQIHIRPRCPYRSYHTLYPPPNDCEFPGPNARRDCAVRYVQEFRLSGTVVVPRMRCWWLPG